MSSLQEKLERAERTAHVSSKHIGLTIALIGVLIAFCAAMVGSEQNKLTRTMTEQTQAHSDYSGASTKFRIVMTDLEKLRSHSSPESIGGGEFSELKRLLRLYLDYRRERDFAEKWVDMYQPAVEAHFDAAEGYDNAQLVAEIGIVVASLAVLLSNRTAWVLSILLGVICIGLLTSTFLKTRRNVSRALGNIRQAESAYQQLRKAHLDENEDERTIEELDPAGKIRADIEKNSQQSDD
jgi:low affinity Fe/Cu permease